MKNAFLRLGYTCVFTMVATGLAFAGSVNPVTVTLPHAVTIGSTVLPEGTYVLESIDMTSGMEYFVVRGEHGAVATLQAVKRDTETSAKTEITLDNDGGRWHFDKLQISGDSTTYVFQNVK